jgi:hypothetical protein
MTFEEYFKEEQAEAHTHRTQNKTVQANSKPAIPQLGERELLRISVHNNQGVGFPQPMPMTTSKPLYHYVHNLKNTELQCEIEDDEFKELFAIEQARLAKEQAE